MACPLGSACNICPAESTTTFCSTVRVALSPVPGGRPVIRTSTRMPGLHKTGHADDIVHPNRNRALTIRDHGRKSRHRAVNRHPIAEHRFILKYCPCYRSFLDVFHARKGVAGQHGFGHRNQLHIRLLDAYAERQIGSSHHHHPRCHPVPARSGGHSVKDRRHRSGHCGAQNQNHKKPAIHHLPPANRLNSDGQRTACDGRRIRFRLGAASPQRASTPWAPQRDQCSLPRRPATRQAERHPAREALRNQPSASRLLRPWHPPDKKPGTRKNRPVLRASRNRDLERPDPNPRPADRPRTGPRTLCSESGGPAGRRSPPEGERPGRREDNQPRLRKTRAIHRSS